MREIKQAAAANVMIFMADGSDHLSGLAGLTPSVSISKNGGTFSAAFPAVADRGDGWYSVSLTESHTDTLGDLVVRATASGADPGERLLSVYSMKDADALRVAGTDQSPRDLGLMLDQTALSSRLLFVRGRGEYFWFGMEGDAAVEGALKFRLAALSDGVLAPYLDIGEYGPEGFVQNPALAGDMTVYEGYVCLDFSQATGMSQGILKFTYLEQFDVYVDFAFWMPILPTGGSDLFLIGSDGTFMHTADGARLNAIDRPLASREPLKYGARKDTFGQLVTATHKNTAASFVCVDGLGSPADAVVSTDRQLPEGVLVYVFATSLQKAGSVYLGTLTPSGWIPETVPDGLGERMALFTAVSVAEGVEFKATALTMDWPGRAQPLKVYLPGKTGPAWTDMMFHGLTGQPVIFGSGTYTGASLAETQSTPSRRAVIIGA